MKTIIVLGAGLSSSSLIKYLLDHSQEHHWKIKVGDISMETAKQKIQDHPNGEAFLFDAFDETLKTEVVKQADVVISLLPARMHPVIAKECIRQGKHMITASYVSDEMKTLDQEAKNKNLLLLNEIGVDPGIDHMSAMKIMDELKSQGAKLHAFRSNTGGLVAPEYDNNPWHYKFTWNPRNVVVAGQSTAQYREEGRYKYIPYQKLFTRTYKTRVLDLGEFEVYPNRDSLSYQETYQIQDIPTLFRGTMRRPGYSEAWNVFVQIGATDDSYVMKNSENLIYRDFINSFLAYDKTLQVESKLAKYVGIKEDSSIMEKLKWLGIFEKRKTGLKNATPAQILQRLLEEKWKLGPEDKDMIVMQHQFDYELNRIKKRITSSLAVYGQDTTHTAMSLTVGLPVAIATKLLLTGQISQRGVVVPTGKEIYEPVLKELETYGITFIEEEQVIEA